ncbi:MAG: PilZ domain-containing protein [Treponema sp.]|jgi:hypothetical protein|nr:PilZ domain-containing protein [Treponema sp.]
MSAYLLELPQFYKTTNPMDVVYLFIGVAVIITILIIINISKKRLGITDSIFYTPRSKDSGTPSVRKFSRSVGLNSAQSKMLSFALKNGGFTDPKQITQSPAITDQCFKQAYNTIDKDADAEKETQQKISLLFSTRNVLEFTTGGGAGINSTRVIPKNTPVDVIIDGESYPTRVVSSQGAYLLVENPVTAQGDAVSVNQNKRITLSFFTKSSNSFSVTSTVYGTTKVPGNGNALQVVHSNAIRRLSQRRFRRRQITIPAEFSQVHLENANHRHEQKLVVDKKKTAGKILDLSVEGCSIQTPSAVSAGVQIRINFTAGNQLIGALGEVLRTNRDKTGTVMHIKFLRVPRKSLNQINALVFEYADT